MYASTFVRSLFVEIEDRCFSLYLIDEEEIVITLKLEPDLLKDGFDKSIVDIQYKYANGILFFNCLSKYSFAEIIPFTNTKLSKAIENYIDKLSDEPVGYISKGRIINRIYLEKSKYEVSDNNHL